MNEQIDFAKRKNMRLLGLGLAGLLTGCVAMKKAGGGLEDSVKKTGKNFKVSNPFKKKEIEAAQISPEENIMLMPTDDFFKKYTPMLFGNAVRYEGNGGAAEIGYHVTGYYFALGPQENSNSQDERKWVTYQFANFFNSLLMRDDEHVKEAMRLFIKSNDDVDVAPSRDLRVVRQGDLVDDILYNGSRRIRGRTAVRPGHIVWKKDEKVCVPEEFIDKGDSEEKSLIYYIKKYIASMPSRKPE